MSGYFNPRPPRGGDVNGHSGIPQAILISIHAPREGGDAWLASAVVRLVISIHAPREGGD